MDFGNISEDGNLNLPKTNIDLDNIKSDFFLVKLFEAIRKNK